LLTDLFYPKHSKYRFHWIGENTDNEKDVAFKFQETPDMVKIRHTGNYLKASTDYGKGVAEAIGIPLRKVQKG
jgi:catalase